MWGLVREPLTSAVEVVGFRVERSIDGPTAVSPVNSFLPPRNAVNGGRVLYKLHSALERKLFRNHGLGPLKQVSGAVIREAATVWCFADACHVT